MVLLFVQLFLEIVPSNPECSGVVVHHLVDLVELCCPFGDVFFHFFDKMQAFFCPFKELHEIFDDLVCFLNEMKEFLFFFLIHVYE